MRMTLDEYKSLHIDRPPKYRNQKTKDGDSKKERARHEELLLMEAAGLISDLRRQVRFELIPAQYGESGKLLENKAGYTADFVYTDRSSGKLVVEDVKSPPTRKKSDYVLRRKLMLWIHGIRILEI